MTNRSEEDVSDLLKENRRLFDQLNQLKGLEREHLNEVSASTFHIWRPEIFVFGPKTCCDEHQILGCDWLRHCDEHQILGCDWLIWCSSQHVF